MTKISVLLCTRNRAQSLARTLQKLLALPQGADFVYDVLVVDNASTDDTRAVVSELHRAHAHLQYRFEPKPGLSFARNTAIRHSTGELLAFTDDDVLVTENWLSELHREFSADPHLPMLCGRVLLARAELMPVAFMDVAERLIVRYPNIGEPVMGANMIVRRGLFEEIGLFDVRLGAGRFFAGGEDTELVYRALKAGHYMLYAPNVLVYHDHDRVTEAQARRLEYSYGKSYAAYLFKHILRGDGYAARAFYWSSLGLLKRLQRQPGEAEAKWRRRRAHVRGILVGLLTSPWVMGWGGGETRLERVEVRNGAGTGGGAKAGEWHDALLLDGESDLIESSVRELTEYFGISRVDALEACVTALRESKREWETEPRDTRHEIEAFYRTTRSYLFEHLWWHATDQDECAVNVALLDYARGIGAYEYLDFGSGVGSNAILFARHGLKVTLADISPTLLSFARWRLQRRGLPAEFIDLNQQPVPRNRFAFVTAVDVLEHLCDPAAELAQLSQALVVGGVFAFNFRAGLDPERPMHILPAGAPIFQALRGCGLRTLAPRDETAEELRRREFYCAKRVTQSRVRRWSYRALDNVRQTVSLPWTWRQTFFFR